MMDWLPLDCDNTNVNISLTQGDFVSREDVLTIMMMLERFCPVSNVHPYNIGSSPERGC